MPLFSKKDESEDPMGCKNTKHVEGKAAEVLDALPEPEAPPAMDPRLPLNARQVFRLKKSWKGIKRNMEQTGIEMFIR